MKIITIIPAYNEEETIKWVVEASLQYSDVLVVNDGSHDNTNKLSVEAGAQVVEHARNLGKGAAIKTGLKNALAVDYDILVLLDGDGQHDPHFIPILASGIGEAGIVIGSRFIGGSPENMPLLRRLSNKLTTKLIDFVTGYHVSDSQSGFRALSRDSAKLFLAVPYDDYIYESEALYRASKKGILIREKSVSCNYKDEKSYITWKNVLNYLLFVLKLLARKLIQ